MRPPLLHTSLITDGRSQAQRAFERMLDFIPPLNLPLCRPFPPYLFPQPPLALTTRRHGLLDVQLPDAIVSSTLIPPHSTTLYSSHTLPRRILFPSSSFPQYIIIILPRMILGQQSNTTLDAIFVFFYPILQSDSPGFGHASISSIKVCQRGP